MYRPIVRRFCFPLLSVLVLAITVSPTWASNNDCIRPNNNDQYRVSRGASGTEFWFAVGEETAAVCVVISECEWVLDIRSALAISLPPFQQTNSCGTGRWETVGLSRVWGSDCSLSAANANRYELAHLLISNIVGSVGGKCSGTRLPMQNLAFVTENAAQRGLLLQIPTGKKCLGLLIDTQPPVTIVILHDKCASRQKEADQLVERIASLGLLSSEPWLAADTGERGFAVSITSILGTAPPAVRVWGELDPTYVKEWLLRAVEASRISGLTLSTSGDPLPSASQTHPFGRIAKFLSAAAERIQYKPFDISAEGWTGARSRSSRDWMTENVLKNPSHLRSTLFRAELARRDWTADAKN